MITRALFISFSLLLLIVPTKSAGTNKAIDCKKIDQQKFKELFKFKFGGGQKGLYLDFGFVPEKSLKFKVENCEFLLKETKAKANGGKSYSKHPEKKKLNGLTACTKYNVIMTVQNIATKKDFTYDNVVFSAIDSKAATLELKTSEVSDDSATLSWNTLSASCVTHYHLLVKNSGDAIVFQDENMKSGTAVVKNLSLCDSYSAQVFAITGRNEQISSLMQHFILKSQKKVEHLNLNIAHVMNDSVALSWSSDSSACMIEYKLNLRNTLGNVIYSANLFNNSTIVNNLNSCSNYSIELIALDDEKLSLKAVIKSFITQSSPIDSVTIKINGSTAKAFWNLPPKIECVANYSVTYSIEDCNFNFDHQIPCNGTKTIEKANRSVSFSPLPLGRRFSLMFYVNEVNLNAAHVTNYTFDTIDYDQFVVQNINEFRLTSTKVQLRWSLNNYLKSLLKHFEVWFDGKVMNTTQNMIEFDVEPCKKNYTMEISCISKDNYRGSKVIYETKLQDDEFTLSSLENNVEYTQKEESVIISWSPKKEEELCISHYEVDFNDQSFKTDKTSTEVNDFAPCITYEINITPISHHGKKGTTTTFEFTTEEFHPKSPTNLKLVEASNTELKISTTISEDDKQCNSTQIEFTCDKSTVIVNVVLLSEDYIGRLTGLHPFTKYNCSAKVRNNIGISESTDVRVFPTKQDAPQPPINIATSFKDNNSIVVGWIADNSTGFAKLFKVQLAFENTIYAGVDGCDLPVKKVKTFETIEASIELSDLKPFSRYSIRISAENDYGVSEFSKKSFFNTKLSKPSAPRDISIIFDQDSEDDLTISGTLEWSVPCNLNGHFSLYTISLKGTKSGYNEVSETSACSYQNITLNDLKRGYNYEVKIQAVNSEYTGVSGFFNFVAPSGLPLDKDIQNWTNLGLNLESNDGRFDVLLRRGILYSEIGEITGIAFLIFLEDCNEHPQPSHGYLISQNISLPSSHENQNEMECYELYQQTDILINPINLSNEMVEDNLNEYNIKFVIGEENCSLKPVESKYCNGRLSPTRYGMMARIYTDYGFRDTQPVYIEVTLNLGGLVTPYMIAYSSALLLILLSLCVVICCYLNYRKNQSLVKKKKEAAAEADENLLSFTSYCVIDRNPKLKNYEE